MEQFLEGVCEGLSLYIRQAAWLRAVPETPGKKISGAPPVSRLKAMEEAGVTPDMPPIDAGYLVEYLFEMGPAAHTAMGESPLSHVDIAAWSGLIGIELHPWEVRAIRKLSLEYLAESQQAANPGRPAPYGISERRKLVAKKIDEVFG